MRAVEFGTSKTFEVSCRYSHSSVVLRVNLQKVIDNGIEVEISLEELVGMLDQVELCFKKEITYWADLLTSKEVIMRESRHILEAERQDPPPL